MARPDRAPSAGCAAQDLNILNILLTPGGCATLSGGRHVPREVSAVEQQLSLFKELAVELSGGLARLSISLAP